MYGFWLLNLLLHQGTSMLEKVKRRGSWQRKRKNRKERWGKISCGIHVYSIYLFCARMYTCLSRVRMVYGIWYMVYAWWNRLVAQSWNISRQGRHIFAEIEYILPSLTPQIPPWFDLQLDAQNSCLFTYNTFIKLLYMFRALPAHLQEVYVVIVYMQPLVSSLCKGELSKITVL
jgi:hypothetical protein